MIQQIKLIKMPRKAKKMGQSPSFIKILVGILDDSKNQEAIRWSEDGESIILPDFTKLADQTLPQYFKHGNVNSFIRQLNMYNFRKISKSSEISLYLHPFFKRGQKKDYQKIKRNVRKLSQEYNSLVKYELQIHQIKQIIGELEQKQNQLQLENQKLIQQKNELVAMLQQSHKEYNNLIDLKNKGKTSLKVDKIEDKEGENQLYFTEESNFKLYVSSIIKKSTKTMK